MAIALNELDDLSTALQAAALALVAVAITGAVYGAVALIVKMDDVGVHLAREGHAARRALGRRIAGAMPRLLNALSVIGTAAMIWVGGSIIVHGLHEFHLDALPDLIHDIEHAGHEVLGGFGEWLFGALAYSVIGLVIGSVIVAIVSRVHRARGGADA